MCRPGGRRCPSSRGRSERGTRPSRDTYTTKIRALVNDEKIVAGISRKIPVATVEFLPRADRAEAKREIAKEMLLKVGNDPFATVTVDDSHGKITSAMHIAAVKDAYETWRLNSGHEDALPFNSLDAPTWTDLNAVGNVAAAKALNSVTEKERDKTIRAANRDLDTAAIRSMNISIGNGGGEVIDDAIEEIKYATGRVHITDELAADALAAMNISEHGRDEFATKLWLKQRGIDPSRVGLVMSGTRELIVHPSGDDAADEALKDRIAREWGVDDEVPNGRELNRRLHSIHDAARDRGVSAEFDRAMKSKGRDTNKQWVMPRDVNEARVLAKAASVAPRNDVHARGPAVGGGDYALAKHLLGGTATLDELADETARLDSVPARFRDPHSAFAIENRTVRALMVESGVHPLHMNADALPPAAQKRVKETLVKHITELGEDFYHDPEGIVLEDSMMRKSLKKRAEYVVSDLFTTDANAGWKPLIGDELRSIAGQIALVRGNRRYADKDTPLAPEETMDPLF